MRLSPKASLEVEKELNEPAADTPERRATFERVRKLTEKIIEEYGSVFKWLADS